MSNHYIDIKRRYKFFAGDARSNKKKFMLWEDFKGEHAVLILGSPGSGKTETFKYQAKSDTHGLYLTVSEYLCSSIDELKDKTLYLDALDETRSERIDNRSKMERVVGKLKELGRPKFFLSCREADWLGKTDFDILSYALPSDTPLFVAKLELLDDEEAMQLAKLFGINEPDAFLKEAKNRNIEDFLANPTTLKLLSTIIQKNGQWPTTKTELFEQACKILVSEDNQHHKSGAAGSWSDEKLLEAAGYIAATMLLSGFPTISTRPNDGVFSVSALQIDLSQAQETLRRRLFHVIEDGRSAFFHRIIAEYLAGRYLAKQVTENALPAERLLALMLGDDGRPVPDLRGLFASFATATNHLADLHVKRDPLGIIFYGDASYLSTDIKRRILKEIVQIAENDPYFRAHSAENQLGYSSRRYMGTLCIPELEDDLREILENEKYKDHNHLISSICEIIEYGTPLPDLRPTLLKIVRDNSRGSWQREEALDAFIAICPDQIEEMRILLRELHEENIQEDAPSMRARLLAKLYPAYLSTNELLDYIIEDKSSLVGHYTFFTNYTLPQSIPDKDIVQVLDRVSAKLVTSKDSETRRQVYGNIHAKLLLRALENKDLNVSEKDLYRWTMPFNELRARGADEETLKKIEKHFNQKSELIFETYRYAIREKKEEISKDVYLHFLGSQLLHAPVSDKIIHVLLEEAITASDPEIAKNLFVSAFVLSRKRDGSHKILIDVFKNAVQKNPSLENAWDDLTNPEKIRAIQEREENQIKSFTEKQDERKKQRKQTQEKDVEMLRSKKADIENGNHSGALGYLGQIYYGRFYDIQGDTPLDRLGGYIGSELTNAAFRGFQKVLLNEKIPSLDEILKLIPQNKHYPVGFGVLAGMDILYSADKDQIEKLPDKILLSAIGFHYTNFTEETNGGWELDKPRGWLSLLAAKRTELVERSLTEISRVYLRRDEKHVSPIHNLCHEKNCEKFAGKLAAQLLREFPNCSENILADLLHKAAKHLPKQELKKLVSDVLSSWQGDGLEKDLWIALGALFFTDQFMPQLQKIISDRNISYHWNLLNFVKEIIRDEHFKEDMTKPEIIAPLLKSCAAAFSPAALPSNGAWWGDGHPWDKSNFVEQLIVVLASSPLTEATIMLQKFIEDPNLEKWKNRLKHEQANQIKKRAEANFKRPTAEAIIKSLHNGRPASTADLNALVLDHMKDLQTEIRDGALDGWQHFWNLDGNRATLSSRREETCRDYIVERLKERLLKQEVDLITEARAPERKRIDIKAKSLGHVFLPLEVKKQNNAELWTAPKDQLHADYMRDANCCGSGIYLVLWFGANVRDAKTTKLPSQPRKTFQTPLDLKAELEKNIKADGLSGIEVIVLDVSSPTD